MDVTQLQTALNASGGTPVLRIDGVPGKNTMRRVEDFLRAGGAPIGRSWSDTRTRVAAEQLIYKQAGIEVGAIDGLVGEQTRYARTVWSARQTGNQQTIDSVEKWRDEPQPETPPSQKRVWPRQSASTMNAFFGSPGTNQVSMSLPFPQRIAWDLGKTIRSVQCHKLVREPLERIWSRTLQHYGHEKIQDLRLDLFGGCLNVRKMRGGSAWSVHSWGCAWDVDPERNQLKWKRNAASLDDPPYKKFWEFVYDEGAISLGIERDYDWMHFQFARL